MLFFALIWYAGFLVLIVIEKGCSLTFSQFFKNIYKLFRLHPTAINVNKTHKTRKINVFIYLNIPSPFSQEFNMYFMANFTHSFIFLSFGETIKNVIHILFLIFVTAIAEITEMSQFV